MRWQRLYDHFWWRNLRGGAPVKVRVRGREMEGVAEAFEGDAAEGGLLTVVQRATGDTPGSTRTASPRTRRL